MKAIGGYFELEINNFGTLYHDDAIALNTGRNSLEHILLCKRYKQVHIPYYTCDVILEPFKKHSISYSFYRIDKNFKPIINSIGSNEALLYTNYFGLMFNNIVELKKSIPNLIIDNAQAFYDKPIDRIPTFYSPRKFFGLPDGGFVYHANELSIESYPLSISENRISHLITRIEQTAEAGYQKFKENDAALIDQTVKTMSKLTLKLMNGIDYQQVKARRIANFNLLHEHLKSKNELSSIIEKAVITCPMIYPFLNKEGIVFRKRLLGRNIFTAQYWPGVIDRVKKNSRELYLLNNLISLPIDQRYSKREMDALINLIV